MSTPQQRLEELGLSLPTLAAPLASYVPVMRSGNLLYISGQLSSDQNGIIKGRLGENIDMKNAQLAAKNCALSILSQITNSANIELQDIQQVIKLSIFVASTPDFHSHHLVANGASDLMVKVLGDKGKHARAAFGVAALPLGAAVEIEAIVQIDLSSEK